MFGAPGRDPRRSFPAVLSDVYLDKGTGALGVADTGHAWWLADNGGGAGLSVVAGRLTNTVSDAAVRAGYVTTSVGARVLRIGGRFTLSSESNPGGGVAAFVIWTVPIGTAAGVPDTGLHLIVSSISWSLSVWESQVQTNLPGGGATFAVPLATNDTTVHTVDVTISGTTASMTFPDGSAADISDARIESLAGPFAGFEVYQSNAATDTKAKFTEVWAST